MRKLREIGRGCFLSRARSTLVSLSASALIAVCGTALTAQTADDDIVSDRLEVLRSKAFHITHILNEAHSRAFSVLQADKLRAPSGGVYSSSSSGWTPLMSALEAGNGNAYNFVTSDGTKLHTNVRYDSQSRDFGVRHRVCGTGTSTTATRLTGLPDVTWNFHIVSYFENMDSTSVRSSLDFATQYTKRYGTQLPQGIGIVELNGANLVHRAADGRTTTLPACLSASGTWGQFPSGEVRMAILKKDFKLPNLGFIFVERTERKRASTITGLRASNIQNHCKDAAGRSVPVGFPVYERKYLAQIGKDRTGAALKDTSGRDVGHSSKDSWSLKVSRNGREEIDWALITGSCRGLITRSSVTRGDVCPGFESVPVSERVYKYVTVIEREEAPSSPSDTAQFKEVSRTESSCPKNARVMKAKVKPFTRPFCTKDCRYTDAERNFDTIYSTRYEPEYKNVQKEVVKEVTRAGAGRYVKKTGNGDPSSNGDFSVFPSDLHFYTTGKIQSGSSAEPVTHSVPIEWDVPSDLLGCTSLIEVTDLAAFKNVINRHGWGDFANSKGGFPSPDSRRLESLADIEKHEFVISVWGSLASPKAIRVTGSSSAQIRQRMTNIGISPDHGAIVRRGYDSVTKAAWTVQNYYWNKGHREKAGHLYEFADRIQTRRLPFEVPGLVKYNVDTLMSQNKLGRSLQSASTHNDMAWSPFEKFAYNNKGTYWYLPASSGVTRTKGVAFLDSEPSPGSDKHYPHEFFIMPVPHTHKDYGSVKTHMRFELGDTAWPVGHWRETGYNFSLPGNYQGIWFANNAAIDNYPYYYNTHRKYIYIDKDGWAHMKSKGFKGTSLIREFLDYKGYGCSASQRDALHRKTPTYIVGQNDALHIEGRAYAWKPRDKWWWDYGDNGFNKENIPFRLAITSTLARSGPGQWQDSLALDFNSSEMFKAKKSEVVRRRLSANIGYYKFKSPLFRDKNYISLRDVVLKQHSRNAVVLGKALTLSVKKRSFCLIAPSGGFTLSHDYKQCSNYPEGPTIATWAHHTDRDLPSANDKAYFNRAGWIREARHSDFTYSHYESTTVTEQVRSTVTERVATGKQIAIKTPTGKTWKTCKTFTLYIDTGNCQAPAGSLTRVTRAPTAP